MYHLIFTVKINFLKMSEKICIIGDGITALMLTKVLLDLNIEIDLINKNILVFSLKNENFNPW